MNIRIQRNFIYQILLTIFNTAIFSSACYFSFYYKTPKIAALEYVELYLALFILLFGLIGGIAGIRRKRSYIQKPSQFLFVYQHFIFIFCFLLGSICLSKEARFHYIKYQVLSAPEDLLVKLGQHFIIGHTEHSLLKTLIKKKAIGGIYLSSKITENQTSSQIQSKLRELQDLFHSPNNHPLLITTDQEGGMVSRLTPPLERPQLLRNFSSIQSLSQRNTAIQIYTSNKGQDLKNIGIHINFSPVVDLDKKTQVRNDRHSFISKRAISSSPKIVADIGLSYVRGMENQGIISTLKHFPGLGDVNVDTHHELASLDNRIQDLKQHDWYPFFDIASQSQTSIMVGHVKIPAIDEHNPASHSQKIIQEFVRPSLPDTILITDDMNMSPIYFGENGIGEASVKALNAGIDFILISYDWRQYFEAMYSVLNAHENAELEPNILFDSQIRIQKIMEFFSRTNP